MHPLGRSECENTYMQLPNECATIVDGAPVSWISGACDAIRWGSGLSAKPRAVRVEITCPLIIITLLCFPLRFFVHPFVLFC